jgi:hypothetical protein
MSLLEKQGIATTFSHQPRAGKLKIGKPDDAAGTDRAGRAVPVKLEA